MCVVLGVVHGIPTCDYESKINATLVETVQNISTYRLNLHHAKKILEEPQLYRADIISTTSTLKSASSDKYQLAFTVTMRSKTLARNFFGNESATKYVANMGYWPQSMDVVVASSNLNDVSGLSVNVYRSKSTKTMYKYAPNESIKINSAPLQFAAQTRTKFSKVDGMEYGILNARLSSSAEQIFLKADTPYWFHVEITQTSPTEWGILPVYDNSVCDTKVNVICYKYNYTQEWQPHASTLDGFGPIVSMYMDTKITMSPEENVGITPIAEGAPKAEENQPSDVDDTEPTTEDVPIRVDEPEESLGDIIYKDKWKYLIAAAVVGLPTFVICFIILMNCICRCKRKGNNYDYLYINKPRCRNCFSRGKYIKRQETQDGMTVTVYQEIDPNFTVQDLATGVIAKVWELQGSVKKTIYNHFYGNEMRSMNSNEEEDEEEGTIILEEE